MAIYKYMDLSTGHITHQDIRNLNTLVHYAATLHINASYYPRVVEHEYGHLIQISADDGTFHDEIERMRKANFSSAIIDALIYARQNECTWIKFDADGDRDPNLKFFS